MAGAVSEAAPVNPDAALKTDSSTSGTRNAIFMSGLLKRDESCTFTGIVDSHCDSVHLIPFSKGPDVRSTL